MIVSLPICPVCGALLKSVITGLEQAQSGHMFDWQLTARNVKFRCGAEANEDPRGLADWVAGCPKAMETIE